MRERERSTDRQNTHLFMHANSHANMQTKIHACTKTQETDCAKYVQMIKRCLHVHPRSVLLGALPIKKPWVCVHPRCTARTIHCPAYKETMGVCAPTMYGKDYSLSCL